jgi:hypothetical protein
MSENAFVIGAGIVLVACWLAMRVAGAKRARLDMSHASAPDNEFVTRLRERLRRE